MDIMMRNWTNTLMEKVYMAKLAVFISVPRIGRTHWVASDGADFTPMLPFEGLCGDVVSGTQGVVPSLAKTPPSLANCSNVIGMKDPIPHMTKTSDAQE
jgi:hypothetical protein